MAKIKLAPVQKSENGDAVQAEDHIVTAQELKEVYEDAAMIADDVGHGVTALAPYCVTGFESDQMFIDKAARAEREHRKFKTNFRKESGEFEVCVGPSGSTTNEYRDKLLKSDPEVESTMTLSKDYVDQTSDDSNVNSNVFFAALSNMTSYATATHQDIKIECDAGSHSVIVRKTPQKR